MSAESALYTVLSGLKGQTTYFIRVQAATRKGVGAYSETIEITTKGQSTE